MLGLDIHNTGGKVPNYNKMKVSNYDSMKEDHEAHHTKSVENGRFDELFKPIDEKNNEVCVKASEVEDLGGCPDLFTRLSIFVSGDVALCAADQAEYFKLGNVIHQDPIQIFNNRQFSHYRKKWLSNSYKELDHCKGLYCGNIQVSQNLRVLTIAWDFKSEKIRCPAYNYLSFRWSWTCLSLYIKIFKEHYRLFCS